ncbi:MAG: CHAT domain-containing protein [Bacteroidota bacterium]
MKAKIFSGLLLLFGLAMGMGQQAELMRIIEAAVPITQRQQQIDSLLPLLAKRETPQILADCYHDLGNKWYYQNWWDSNRSEDIVQAINYTQKAYEIKVDLETVTPSSLKKTLFNLGYFHNLNDQVFDAIDVYAKVLEAGDVDRKTQLARLELGRTYTIIGDYHAARTQLTEILAFYGKDPEAWRILLDTHVALADTYSLMGYVPFSDQIQFHLSQANTIMDSRPHEDIAFDKPQIHQIEGNRLLRIGDFQGAIAAHQQVIQDSVYLYPENVAIAHNSLALSQLRLGHLEAAQDNLKQAQALYASYSDVYNNKGDLELEQGNFKTGLSFYQQAIDTEIGQVESSSYKSLPTLADIEVAPEKIYLLNHIVTKANGWLRYYYRDNQRSHLEAALETFVLADQLVDLIRAESTELQSKLFWREKGSSLYLKAVEVCYLLDRPAQAYYFVERNKALLLLEDISRERAKKIADLPQAMAKREYQLKQAIFLASSALRTANDSERADQSVLQSIVYQKKRAYAQFADSLAQAFPVYTKLQRDVVVLDHKQFKERYVGPETAVLHYILDAEQGYGLLHTQEDLQLFNLAEVSTLQEQLQKLFTLITDQVVNPEQLETYHQLGYQVFKQLLPPEVYQSLKGKQLLLIPDHSLQQLPFGALVTNAEEGRYLIEEAEIRYAYSMTYLDAKALMPGKPKKGFLGVAPVGFDEMNLPKLGFSDAEVSQIGTMYKGASLLYDKATKRSVLEAIFQYKMVHLSTHADIAEDGNHWIAFADNKLFLDEIYATINQAEMVVLSACNTGLGKVQKGEGVMSLARGFFHSGAQSVVSSLWAINDKASKDLMVDFYSGLEKGLTKSAALRSAKLRFIEKHREIGIPPAYWASLIVIGDNSPISNGSHAIWIIVLGILLALGLLGGLYYLRRMRFLQKRTT